MDDDRDGPLPTLLLALTVLTGLVDAVSFLALGRVFVANMTGNVVFLGFAAGGAAGFSIVASLLAIVAFLGGALAGGRLGARSGAHRGRLLALTLYAEVLLVAPALAVSFSPLEPDNPASLALVVLLSVAMGLQNASARRLAVADLTTTVLTLTLTGLAADSAPAGGANPNPQRRLLAVAAMFLGAAIGAVLLLHAGVASVLAVALALLVVASVAGYRVSSSAQPWAAGRK
jgi:uncharacterized membrane protein YoaK (UPF0700 family)